MKKLLLIWLAAFAAVSCAQEKQPPKPLYMWFDCEANYATLSHPDSIRYYVSKIHDMGFTDVVVDVKSIMGETLYKSDIAPYMGEWEGVTRPENYDLLGYFIEEGHKLGMRVHGSLNVFAGGHNYFDRGIIYGDHADWQSQVYTEGKIVPISEIKSNYNGMLNPANPEVQEYELAILKEFAGKYPDVDGIVFDRGVMKALEGKTMEPLLTMTDDFIERIGMCGLPSVYFLFGALSGKEWSIPVLSHEGPFGVGYGVCLCLPEEADGRKEAHDIRVRLARDSIAEYLKTGKLPKPPADIPEELKERAGVFVSLHEFGALRGCIGTILPVRNSAAEEIIHNAKAAASEDPRFPPVNPYELDDLDISVDVLSAPEPISSEGDLDPKIYGVIVERGFQRGLLLPDLPGITDPREQVEIARRKAGIGTDEPVKMYRFTVRRYY